jgi:putative membrane-bound dehydrogenase-like protein
MKSYVTLLMISLPLGSAASEIQPAPDAPKPLSPPDSAARIRLPEGFRIDLVASEPLIQEPSCIAFDEQERLFVCELHGYNAEGHLDVIELNKTGVLDTKVRRLRWEQLGGKIAQEARKLQYGVVKLLTDTDGDGRIDKAEVWAKDLPPCYGLVAARGGVIVVCAPDIVYLADRDGDGKVDVRETLFTGFHIREMERGINNPEWGLDNWIYVGAGHYAGTIRGPHLAKPVQLGNQDFRIKADGSAIEPVSGNVGTFGLAMNDIGDRFPASGDEPAVYALPLPYHYLARNPYVPTPPANHTAANYSRGFRISQPDPWRVRRGQDPAWVKFYGQRETDNNYFSGGCGGLIYRAGLFPQKYVGNFFYCEPSLNLVHRSILARDGAGYKAHRAPGEEQSEFLASTDQWFRPINLRVGPDGALYIVDMYREIIEDYSAIPRFLQQQYGLTKGDDRGRIWRLVPTPQAQTSRGRDARDSWPSGHPPARFGTDELVRATGDANPWWRETAQRLLIDRRDLAAAPALSAQIRGGATPQSRLHALYTLEGLGELQSSDVAHALEDAHYGVRLHALRLADRWLGMDHELLVKVLAMTDDDDPSVRLQVAMTLGESRDERASDALLILTEQHGDERWMPAAITSSARESAGTLLAALLSKPKLSQGAKELLAPLTATLGGRRDVPQMELVLNTIQGLDETIQKACLTGLINGVSQGAGPAAESQDGWASLKSLLGSESAEVRMLAATLGARLGLTDSRELQAMLAEAAKDALDANRPVDERQRAIELLANAPYAILEPCATRLLDAQQPPTLQQAAIEALGSSEDAQVGVVLLGEWPGLTPKMRQAVLLTILARENRLPALLDAIQNKVVRPGDINAIQREQLLTSRNEEIAARARSLLESPAEGAELEQRIDRYQKALAGPRNPQRGKQIFATFCLACHKLKEEGFEVGPPLGSVTNKPDEAILRDILDPSTHIESEFESYIVVTSQGRTFTGVLVSESATSVTLAMEKGMSESILRSDIDQMKASDVSLMPSNLHQQIGPQDAADLIAFLRGAFGSADSGNRDGQK